MNAISPGFACAAGGMPFEAAQARVLALVPQPLAVETVSLEECVGRATAAPVAARLCLPGFDQSAMDGYAVASAGLTPGAWLPVTGRTAAGEAPGRLVPGGAHRILTGAPVPEGADVVIAQEGVVRHGDLLQIGAVPPRGTNLRRRGEDVRSGDVLIHAGTLLDWRHVTVLASQAIEAVAVRRRPRVVLLSSGRELWAPGQSLAPGQIHDSNLPMLRALLGAWGAEVRPRPVVADEPAAMRAALRAAAEQADLVLTTAGISVGDEDHVRDAIGALGGDLAVLKVAMKPGKPLAAGRIGEAAFVGLPGNPQAALAGALAFVRPLLARMTGTAAPAPLGARAGFSLRRKAGRAEFLPVRLHAEGACLRAERTGPDGSGRLSPLLAADGLAYVPAGQQDVQPGDLVEVLPFHGAGVAHA
ncbi:molybdopterin molybdotransferase MoeA [Roseomonas sp. E05]|uniref:molybdopterin molybdotransferase MoeA n=1 Tax=Roseomonas sp. E05 TaxID=3046310 RepID=UPI0024B9A383|nr:gephyrin-like molybdotransferase Glp [Roseomonas sp. E05]MDJ0390645.1 molybdopterin molybdotransferase MoeA [Roseomonas sp. E05]